MRYYTLEAVVHGNNAKLDRQVFASRKEAIDYMFSYFEKHYIYGLEVETEHTVDNNKHSIEYVCNYYNRFTITRKTLDC